MSVSKLHVNPGDSPLKAVRNLLGKTQQEFASWLGISTTSVSRWENGHGEPVFTVGQFLLLTEALEGHGLTLKDLPREWSRQTGLDSN